MAEGVEKQLAIIEVPARVRDNSKSTSIVLDKLGGPNLCSIALERRLPLEYRLSSHKNAHPLVGKVDTIKEKGNSLGKVHRVLLRLKTSGSGEAKKVDNVNMVGLVDTVGNFREPSDFRFMNGVGDSEAPTLTMVPVRFDGPVSSLMHSKDTSVVRRYSFRDARVNGDKESAKVSLDQNIVPYDVTPMEPPPGFFDQVRRADHRKIEGVLALVREAFEKRPVWGLVRLGQELAAGITDIVGECNVEKRVKECIRAVAYKVSKGPWCTLYVKLGYNLTQTPEARIYQVLFVWQMKDGDILPVKKKRGEYEFEGGVQAPKEWGGMAQRMKLQLCDVADVNAQQLILSLPRLSACTERSGWYAHKDFQQIRTLMSQVVRGVAGLSDAILCLKDPLTGLCSLNHLDMFKAIKELEVKGTVRIIKENEPPPVTDKVKVKRKRRRSVAVMRPTANLAAQVAPSLMTLLEGRKKQKGKTDGKEGGEEEDEVDATAQLFGVGEVCAFQPLDASSEESFEESGESEGEYDEDDEADARTAINFERKTQENPEKFASV